MRIRNFTYAHNKITCAEFHETQRCSKLLYAQFLHRISPRPDNYCGKYGNISVHVPMRSMVYTTPVFTKFKNLYTALHINRLYRISHTSRSMGSTDRNSFTPYRKDCHPGDFHKSRTSLTTVCKKKNSYTNVHENPTNGVGIDTESHRNE